MKKILTVSLFAMMAVSAANAEIASTDYVGKQITATAGTLSNLSTEEKTNLVGAINELKDEMTTMDGGYGEAIDELSSNFSTYKTTNDAAVEAAKKAGDDAQADIDAYIESNDAALALKADSADVYTKAAADAEFMNSSEVSTAIANAVTGDSGALKDYSTTTQMNTAIADANDAQTSAITTAYEAADATTLSSAKTYAKEYADGLAGNYDASGSAAQALTDAKAYADAEDKKIEDTIGTVESGKTVVQMINEASTSAGTNLTNALKDYSTTTQMNTAIADANDAQTSAITTAYEAADATTLSSAKTYAKEYADGLAGNYDAVGSAAAAQTAAVNVAKTAADATYQVKSSALSVGAAGGAWTDLTKAAGYSETGTHSLVLKNGTIQWEAVSY